MDVLEDLDASAKEKRQLLRRQNVEELAKGLNFEQRTRTIQLFEANKNFEIGKFLKLLLQKINLKPFSKELVIYMSKKSSSSDHKLSKFLVRFYKLPTATFAQNYLDCRDERSLNMLLRKFKPKAFTKFSKKYKVIFEGMLG